MTNKLMYFLSGDYVFRSLQKLAHYDVKFHITEKTQLILKLPFFQFICHSRPQIGFLLLLLYLYLPYLCIFLKVKRTSFVYHNLNLELERVQKQGYSICFDLHGTQAYGLRLIYGYFSWYLNDAWSQKFYLTRLLRQK